MVSFPELPAAAGEPPTDLAKLVGQRSTAAFQQWELQGVTRIGEYQEARLFRLDILISAKLLPIPTMHYEQARRIILLLWAW